MHAILRGKTWPACEAYLAATGMTVTTFPEEDAILSASGSCFSTSNMMHSGTVNAARRVHEHELERARRYAAGRSTRVPAFNFDEAHLKLEAISAE